MSELPSTQGSGLAPNVAGALAYLLGPLTGVIFLLVEKENGFVRFHAAHSIVVGIALFAVSFALSILSAVLGAIPVLGWLVALMLTMVLGLGSFVLWVLLMYKAFQGQEWEVPGIGGYARRLVAAPSVQ